jgi:hypothetical protein
MLFSHSAEEFLRERDRVLPYIQLQGKALREKIYKIDRTLRSAIFVQGTHVYRAETHSLLSTLFREVTRGLRKSNHF